MSILLTIFHVISCLVLIFVILLQSGRGGGLSEMMGGGVQQNQKVFGTQTSSFLTKATSYCAILFIVTSISLGIVTSNKSKSLLKGQALKPIFNQEENLAIPEDLRKEIEAAATEAKQETEEAVNQQIEDTADTPS